MIKLEAIGKVESVQAGQLVKGDVIMFNFGILGTIEGFGNETPKTKEFLIYSHESKVTALTKWKKDKQVAIV